MKEEKYILGLDLGVASIGWAAVQVNEENEPTKILNANSVVFTSLDNHKGELFNSHRREKRGARRVNRRKKERLHRIKSLLINHKIVDSIEVLNKTTIPLLKTKTKGLSSQLELEELAKCLIHYAKHRGFKSNRKIDLEKESEDKKIKGAISHTQTIMKTHNFHVSEALLYIQQQENKTTLKNEPNEYTYFFGREDMEAEATALLQKQQEYYPNLITDEFIESYLVILLSQRDFSEGPAKGSKYHVSFESMMGMCSFRPTETRIVKSAPSFELFRGYQTLQNIRFCFKDSTKLTTEQTNEAIAKALSENTKILKYKDLLEIIGGSIEEVKFVNLPNIAPKKYKELMQKYKVKLGITDEQKLTTEQFETFNQLVLEERLKANVLNFQYTKELTKYLPDAKIEVLDQVATLLSYAQTDAKIDEYIQTTFSDLANIQDTVKSISWKNKGTGHISLSLVQELNAQFEQGKTYTEAMQELGYVHYEATTTNCFVPDKFPTIAQIETAFATKLTNPNVKHTLTILRKLYRKIVAKYGVPTRVHIEMARDMQKSFAERNQITREQQNNMVRNQEISKMLTETHIEHFKSKNKRFFTNDDLLKVKLYEQQRGICIYTGKKIDATRLLTNDYQIDHILPFSRTFDNSQNNKVVCFAKANQEKRNRTPREWMNDEQWLQFKERVQLEPNYSRQKTAKLLFVGELKREEFTERQLHATSYTSKVCKDTFELMLGKKQVQVYKGQMTSYLRKYYKLNKLTHSLETPTMDRTNIEYTLGAITLKNTDKTIGFEITAQTKLGVEETGTYTLSNKMSLYPEIARLANEIINVYNTEFKGKEINSITHRNYVDWFDKASIGSTEAALIITVIQALIDSVKASLSMKSRDHHYHHALDAVLIAIMTKSMEQKIVKFSQLLYAIQTGNEHIYDENGEQITKETLQAEHHYQTTSRGLPEFPLPYKNFITDIETRIFQKDQERFKVALDNMGHYTKEEIESLQPTVIHHVVNRKMQGGLHEETIYGLRYDSENQKQAVLRKSVFDLKKVTDLEKLVDKGSGQKAVYEALQAWFKTNRKTIPTLPNGIQIKKVRIYGGDPDKLILVQKDHKKLAKIESLHRLLVCKKQGSDKLYAAQIDNFRATKLKSGNTDFEITLWCGIGKNKYEIIQYSQLAKSGFSVLFELVPNQLIQLNLESRASGICRFTGFSSGYFEFKSICGDNLDLVATKLTDKVTKKQQTRSIAKIQSIKEISQTILGEIL